MKKFLIGFSVVCSFIFVSCSPEGWTMDYGKSKAQLAEAALADEGASYLGEKVVVEGVVASVDVSNSKEAWVHLEGGTKCNFGHFTVMAESCEVGSEVLVSGILKKDESGVFYLDPALLRSSGE